MTVDNIFGELRSKGHIKKSKKCKASGLVPNFKAGVLFRRTIFYGSEYENLEDDLLRFALLHEEGHHQGKQNSHLVIGVSMAVILSSMALVNWVGASNPKVIQPILWGLTPFYVWLLLASMRIFGGAIQKDEFRSDSIAAKTLRDAYAINKPSEVLDRLLKALTSSKEHDSVGYRLYGLFFGAMHPSDEERVRRIREKVDA